MKVLLSILILIQGQLVYAAGLRYVIVDTAQHVFYSDKQQVAIPKQRDVFYGQDAHYVINQASYTDNKDGTISDNMSGLMWQKAMYEKMTYQDAIEKAKALSLAGHTDWRFLQLKNFTL